MLEVDRSLFLWLNGCHHPVMDTFWLAMTSNWVWVLFFIPVAYFLFKKYGKKGFFPAVCVSLLFLVADQGTNVAKYYFVRPRPCRAEELQGLVHFIASHCGEYGFWSAHAANVFAQVTFFIVLGVIPSHLRRYIYPYFIVFALLVSVSRIMVGVHYPIDILVGMVYGMVCGLLVYALYMFLAKKFKIEPING